MSNRKSLGSSPIGLRTQGSMAFIPDYGISKSSKRVSKSAKNEKSSEKKTVSYYLEKDLIAKVKSVADAKDICYSALVSDALQRWIFENG